MLRTALCHSHDGAAHRTAQKAPRNDATQPQRLARGLVPIGKQALRLTNLQRTPAGTVGQHTPATRSMGSACSTRNWLRTRRGTGTAGGTGQGTSIPFTPPRKEWGRRARPLRDEGPAEGRGDCCTEASGRPEINSRWALEWRN